MADGMTITVETQALLNAIKELPKTVLRHVKAGSKTTADNVAREAAMRFLRRTGGQIDGLTVEETHSGDGYVVFVKRSGWQGVPGAFEFGTKFMTKRPFLFVSAALEEGAHDRRMRDAVQAGIDEEGLG